MHSRLSLASDLRTLGLAPGDTVMVHASVRAVGAIAGGPDQIHLAIKDAIGPDGTLLMYASCPDGYDEVGRGTLSPDAEAELLEKLPPFDATTARSARSAQPTTRPILSAARWVARAWTRKRSGFSSQPPLDSKKSKLGAVPARARTPAGLRTSRAAGTPATPPATRPPRLAWRKTEIASETSLSTASMISPTRTLSAVAAAITRSRASRRTGKRSTASKASARRLPGAAAFREPVFASPCRAARLLCAVVTLIGTTNRQQKRSGLAQGSCPTPKSCLFAAIQRNRGEPRRRGSAPVSAPCRAPRGTRRCRERPRCR